MKTLCTCVLIATASACVAKAPSTGATDGTSARTSRNRDLITQDDLDAQPGLRANSVLEVVRQLRPHFLTDRGNNTVVDSAAVARGVQVDPEAGKVHVSIDNGRIVSLSELNSMHANEVIEIRYLSSGQAMARFGTAARQGPLILVKTTMVR